MQQQPQPMAELVHSIAALQDCIQTLREESQVTREVLYRIVERLEPQAFSAPLSSPQSRESLAPGQETTLV